MIRLTKKQARQFILVKQGLIGSHRFLGKQGVVSFIRQAGCVQFDPIDVCGRNAELVLQSRIKDFTKQMLNDLLYKDRVLLDYFDKNLSIIDIEDWKYFERIRERNRNHGRGKEQISKVEDHVKEMIATKGPMCSKDIGLDEKIDWYWSSAKLSRAVLETLYFRGDLIVHHKKGTIKHYALAKDYIPAEILHGIDPNETELEYMKWRVLRRISAVGMLWNKPSDAWICIEGMKASERNQIFAELLEEQKIIELEVIGVKDKLYCLAEQEDRDILQQVMEQPKLKARTELIAALDSMLWDRKLVKALFDFDYKWEIYTPISERKFGYYVLPVLHGTELIGRTEAICDRKNNVLNVRNIWLEDSVKMTSKLKGELQNCFQRFMNFQGFDEICYFEDCDYMNHI